jgi:periplasmic protein TonB
MRRKGDIFIPSLGIALAAHALLFFSLAQILSRSPASACAGLEISIVEAGPSGAQGDAQEVRPGPPAPAPVSAPVLPTPGPLIPHGEPNAAALPEGESPEVENNRVQSAPDTVTGGDAASVEPGGNAPKGEVPAEQAGSEARGQTNGPGAASGLELSGGRAVTSSFGADPLPSGAIEVSYPALARRLNQQGVVSVQAEIDDQGKVISARVYASSGHRLLDAAALEAVKKTRFIPSRRDGKPIASSFIVPIRFRLNDE